MQVRNDNYTVYKGFLCRLYQMDGKYRLQTDINSEVLKEGFSRYENKGLESKVFIDLIANEIKSAYHSSTYCVLDGNTYYLENIINNKVILAPNDETKKKLGLHVYDDRRIEMEYKEFISSVSEIWEERKPFDNFKFDTQAKVYVKGPNSL